MNRRLVSLVAATLAVIAVLLPLGAAPAAAAPTLALDRSTGLLDGDVVIATGTGYPPGASIRFVQCIGDHPGWCEEHPLLNGNVAVATVAADGSVRARLRLWRSFDTPSGADQLCTAGDCSVVAVHDDDEVARAFFDVEETGTATRPPASLAVTTTSVRANRVVTTWAGSGFDPDYLAVEYVYDGQPLPLGYVDGDPGAYVAICVPGPGGGEECHRFLGRTIRHPVLPPVNFLWSFPVDAGGAVATSGVTVPRVLSTRDGRVDCAVVGCRVALTQDDFPVSNSVAVPWAPEWAPYPSAAAMVADAYPRLVGRAATAAERSAAIAGLTDRSLTGRAFVAGLAERADGRRYAEVVRLYQAALNRRPDGNGVSYWSGELRRNGGSMNAIAAAFGRTPEFRSRYGPTVSDEAAVRNAYVSTLYREGTASERAYWVGRLRAGMSRTHMIHLFSRTPEFVGNEGGRSRAAAVAIGLLGRGPTADEWFAMQSFVGVTAPARPERVEDQLLAYLGSELLRRRVA